MKIVALDASHFNKGDIDWSLLKSLGNLTIYDDTPTNLIIERAIDADILLTNKVIIDKTIIAALTNLKFIAVMATGYNNVDIEAASANNIVVSNIRGYSTNFVAQHTFALMLELTNQCGLHGASVASGGWNNTSGWSYWKTPLTELSDKTLGIIGFGSIGQKVAKIAKGFDLKVIASHKHPERDKMEGVTFHSLDYVLKNSDIISLHCPLNKDNFGFINAKSIKKMKKTSILINTSRGSLINESDLAEALKYKVIAGAGLDVLSQEPPSSNNPLIGIPNCIVTPHIAWASYESRKRLMNILADNIKAFKEGKPKNVIT